MVVRVPEDDLGLARTRGGNITAIDFRETSPKESSKEMYGVKKAGRMAAQVGGLAVGVPGELRGLEAGELESGPAGTRLTVSWSSWPKRESGRW